MREAGANLSRIFRVIEGLKVGLKAAEGCMDEWTWTDCATTGPELLTRRGHTGMARDMRYVRDCAATKVTPRVF